jgi:hypothetical protein
MALVPRGRLRVGFVAADASVDEDTMVARANEVGNDGHDQAAGLGTQGVRFEPLTIGCDGFGRRLIKHIAWQIDRDLVLDYAVYSDLTQLKHTHDCSIL